MIVSMINTVDYGSTGKIMLQLKTVAESKNYSVATFSRRWIFKAKKKNNHHFFGFAIENLFHRLLSPLFGCESLMSFWGTLSLCKQLKKNGTELIHLHNIHGHYLCFPILFRFIKKNHIPIIWTLHDCWSFTGRCPHFLMTKCDKWISGCNDCPYPRNFYPQAYIDTSRMMWKLKRKSFIGIEKCILTTPSQWLANLVKKSFLKDYPVNVIHNGIDLSVFKPTESLFREIYGLVHKKILLGVAFGWGKRKGIDVFVELSKRLPNEYKVVLVGTSDRVDALLPKNILSIHRTQSQKELAEIYSAADVFVNPTREDNYPTVNMEALACGTPVVTFKTGGSPEILDESCGSVVDCDDVDAMELEIRRICEKKVFFKNACLKRAKLFDMNNRFEEYVDLYRKYKKNDT